MKNRDMPAKPPNAGWRDNNKNARGLTKLEYAAIQIMAGLEKAASPKDLASFSVHLANALFDELEKQS